MTHCDAIIVGGGPAGSTCAWRLRQAGLDVMVLDKKPFPRDKTCAGWITPAVIDELELDASDYGRRHVLQPITGFRVGVIDGRASESHYGAPVSFGIIRREFDHYLLQRSGARLQLGQPLRSMVRTAEGWSINGEWSTPLLIGAGGHFCPVARHLGGGSASETVVAAQEVEFALSERQASESRVRPQVPELYFSADLMGYAWCFRKGPYLNIGLGREDPQHLPQHVERFCQWMIQQGRIPHDTPMQFHGHAYILYGHADRPLFDDSVLIIGDAAGLAYAQSGEGIRPAIESATLAARTIVAARGDYRCDHLAPYEQRLQERLGPRRGEAAATWMPAKLKQTLATHLLATRWFARHVVLDRWFLHRHQPALVS
jgi:geranylgeranyl reductase family protein